MKNITFSADENLIEAARERARSRRTTLNEEFRRWLRGYADGDRTVDEAMRLLEEQQEYSGGPSTSHGAGTLRLDEHLIKTARHVAQSRHISVNELFRSWLEESLSGEEIAERAMAAIRDLQTRIKVDRKYTRDEMNER